MNLLHELILEEEQKGKCIICYRVLENEGLFCTNDEEKVYFCCKNCKTEWLMKNSD